MTPGSNLRERKKLATRAALSRTALRMAVEHGLDWVSPERVAEAAGVSPRTFRNYFASREEAIVDGLAQHAESIAEALRRRPADEAIWDSLLHVLPTALDETVREVGDVVALLRLVHENPAMLAQHLAIFERVNRLMVEVIAGRTGTDADTDLTPHLLAAAAAAAMKTALDLWSGGRVDTDLARLVRRCLSQIRAGIPA